MQKILTVDDSSIMRKLIVASLAGKGYEVSKASGGDEAMELIKNTIFNLILLDINMPKIDGISLLKTLRATPQHKFTPIIMVTSEDSFELKKAAKDGGASGWIAKPFKPETLLEAVKKLLG